MFEWIEALGKYGTLYLSCKPLCHVDCRPKKNFREAPMLPTWQSLRLRNKDPDGVTLPDLPIKQEPVDEHVSTKKILEWSVIENHCF